MPQKTDLLREILNCEWCKLHGSHRDRAHKLVKRDIPKGMDGSVQQILDWAHKNASST